ncbi:ABC transporter ATP-binding protein [Nonomuraea rubra]
MMTDAAAGLMLPAMLGAAVDAVLDSGDPHLVIGLACALLVTITLTEVAAELLEARISAQATARLRMVVFRHLFSVGWRHHQRFTTGDLMSRTLEGAAETARAGVTLAAAGVSLLTALGGLTALLVIDYRVGAVFLIGLPFVWLLGRWFVGRTSVLTVRYQQAQAELAGRFVDAVHGLRTIRASGTVDREAARVLTPLTDLSAAGREFWRTQRTAVWRMALLSPAMYVGVLGTAGHGVMTGRVTPGELAATTAYLGFAMSLVQQVNIMAALGRIRGSAARVQEVLDLPARPAGSRPLPPTGGMLSLRGVRVSVAGTPVLDGVDLDVPAGHTVALVGVSGAGKSTLAAVAGGLITPDAGVVRLDGVDLTQARPEQLRSAVAYAFEQPALLGRTVAEAVGYSDEHIPSDAVRRAVEVCRAATFVDRLPMGGQTATRDLKLSGGELQRLGLARAACREARLIILDDALSSVDTATEAEIAAALRVALQGATKLVVAHRQSTAARADLVAWLDEGRIRAVASHRELSGLPAYRAVFGHVAQPQETAWAAE